MDYIKSKLYKVLRWSEQFTKTDNVYLARGGFWLTIGQILATLASFAVAVAFANLLPKETYGIYQFVLSWAAIFAIAALPGLDTAIVRSVARGREGMVSEALKTKLRWGLWGALASLGFAAYYFYSENTILAGSFLVISLFVSLLPAFQIYTSLLQGKKEFRINAYLQAILNIVTAGFLVTVLFLTDNLFIILATYFASWTLLRWLLLRATLRRFRPNPRKDPSALSYGKHLSIMGAMITVATRLDKLLLFHFLGAAEVAVYSLAVAPILQLRGLLNNIYVLALPKLALRSQQGIRQSILRRVVIFSIFLVPIVIAYIIAAPYIYKIFFPTYIESVPFSQFFAISLLLVTAGGLPGAAMDAHLEVRRKYTLKIFSTGSKVILMLLLFPFGIWGIMGGILLSQFLSLILAVWLVIKP